jgi:hypothetical protein
MLTSLLRAENQKAYFNEAGLAPAHPERRGLFQGDLIVPCGRLGKSISNCCDHIFHRQSNRP